MQLRHQSLRNTVGALIAILALTVIASAQSDGSAASRVRIKNFGQMDERFYRGAQPDQEDFKDLAALGIKTVIDLRADPVKYEKSAVESLGMKYINIPMMGKKYPTEEAIQSFLKIVDDPATGKFYVHCAGGRHRTGAMGAVYRYTKYGWNFEQVYAEMKKFDFYTSWGHGAFKDFVEDYYQRMQATQAQANASQAATAATAETPKVETPKAETPKTTAVTVQTTDSIQTTDSLASPK
jgi:protein tyrosine phosphatase (PTP) superfamily phosphohydrolase (DUF442 family)